MASTLIECKKFDSFIGENYQTVLNRLIQEVLDSPNSEKFSSLSSNFQELLLSKPNPPLETIWFYSGLEFRSSSSTNNGRPSKRFASIEDLFQLTVARSASFNSWKNIVLIAPVIYELFGFMVDFKGLELKPKKKKKLVEEVKDLVGSVLGYVNVCCEGLSGNFDDVEGLIKPVEDLVDVWIGDKGKGKGDGDAGLREFFPLLSDHAVGRISAGELELNELAGFVIAEAFLLKLCFEYNEGGSRKELQSEMRSWIACSISVLQNPFFYGTLLMMLLEPSLPTASLLGAEGEMFLKELLYDALILVDYSFLEPKQMTDLPNTFARGISMARLIVTSEAIQLYRKQGNHKKAVSYSSAFSASSLPSHVIKLVRNEIDKEGGNTSEPSGSSPAALLRWIRDIESYGTRILDDNMSKICAKLVIDDASEDTKRPAHKSISKKSDEDLLFYIDNKGEEDDSDKEDSENEDDDEEMKESMSAAFVAAARTMHSTEQKPKKRKGRDSEWKKVKFVKHNLYDESHLSEGKSVIQQKGDSESGSEVENPSSDDE